MMKFLDPIQTPYGPARVVAATSDGGYLVSLRKADMTKQHPNYRGGPCVNWIVPAAERPSASALMGRVTQP